MFLLDVRETTHDFGSNGGAPIVVGRRLDLALAVNISTCLASVRGIAICLLDVGSQTVQTP